jgi:hypothetical protein
MIRQRFLSKQIGLTFAVVIVIAYALSATAQSTSLDYPTPITGDQLSGVIQARDIGDSRLTRHFYVLSGTTGDLTIALQYSNLNGDIDLFTLDGMRPLAKIGLVASDNTIKVERTVFLRIEEKLILRVEAKSANDDPGRYQIHFSGTFSAIVDAADAPPPPTVEGKTTSTNRRRVTTAGEVIIEPEPEPVAKAEPPPKPAPAVASPAKPRTRPARGTATPTARSTPNPTGSGTGTTGTARNTRTGRAKTAPPTTATPPADTNATNPAPTASTARPAPRKPTNRSTARTTPATSPAAPTPAPEPDPMANARLVVETRDGGLHEHYMRDVRRFTVEKGILLVIMKDGKTERQPMSNVLRVVIEP